MATYYVSSQASGGGSGTEGSPYTIQEAANNVAVTDKVWVKNDGQYVTQDGATGAILELTTAGTSSTGFVEWEGYTTTIGDGGVAILNADTNTLTSAVLSTTTGYQSFKNFRFTGGSGNGFAGGITDDHFHFINCEFDNNDGLGFQGDDACVFIACLFHNNALGAIDCDNNAFLMGNKFYSNSGATIVTTAGQTTAIGNLWYGNGNQILLYCNAGSTVIMNNTFDGDSAGTAAAISLSGSSSVNNAILNNIFMDFTNAVTLGGPYVAQASVDYNMFVNVTNDYDANYAGGANDIDTSTDPFEDSTNRDYTLSSGSAAIDAGIGL